MLIIAVCVLIFIRLRGLPVNNDKLVILGTDHGTDSKFATNKELIVLNILRCKYCVISHVICHVTIFLKILNN